MTTTQDKNPTPATNDAGLDLELNGLTEFDLPAVEGTPSVPKLHIAVDVCLSCEG